MSRVVGWLACAYVALLFVGRSGLPLNVQWGDGVFPFLALAVAASAGSPGWWRREDWPVVAYVGVTFLAALLSPEPGLGLGQVAKQAYLVTVFLVFRRLSSDGTIVEWLQTIFSIVAAVVALASIVLVFMHVPRGVPMKWLGDAQAMPVIGVVRRIRGLVETPELFGNLLLVAFVAALAQVRLSRPERRSLWIGLATLIGSGAVLTYSRSVAGFAVATVFYLAPLVPWRAMRALLWSAAISVVAVVNVASMVAPSSQDRATHYEVGSVTFNALGTTIQARLVSYAALKGIAWTALVEGRLTSSHQEAAPHYDLTGRLAETGFPGGLILLALWATWIGAAWSALKTGSPARRAAAAAVLGLLINSLNADVMNFRFLWVAVAFLMAGPRADEGDD